MPLSSGSLAPRRRLTWVSSWLAWNGRGTGRSGCPFSSGPGIPYGLWIGTADADYIYHEDGGGSPENPVTAAPRPGRTSPHGRADVSVPQVTEPARAGARLLITPLSPKLHHNM